MTFIKDMANSQVWQRGAGLAELWEAAAGLSVTLPSLTLTMAFWSSSAILSRF